MLSIKMPLLFLNMNSIWTNFYIVLLHCPMQRPGPELRIIWLMHPDECQLRGRLSTSLRMLEKLYFLHTLPQTLKVPATFLKTCYWENINLSMQSAVMNCHLIALLQVKLELRQPSPLLLVRCFDPSNKNFINRIRTRRSHNNIVEIFEKFIRGDHLFNFHEL